nr:hypothetical protein [Pseudomonas fuscovaginae]
MSSVLSVLLPIFALILVGFICRRSERLGPNAASEINRMVVWLCLPALLLSALPTGTGPFMLAEYYKREASLVSGTILISTLGSLLTLSICLYLIGN